MAVPSTQIIAIWIKNSLAIGEWVSLRDIAVMVLKEKWRKDEFEILAFLEDKLPFIAEHLRNNLADCIEDGKLEEYEIDNESPPYIKRVIEVDHDLLDHLRNIDPYKFEHVCAAILKGLGADSTVTKASHDNGIDFYATKLRVVPTQLPFPSSCHGLVIGQAKRYQDGSAISETRLREFVGASLLQRHRFATESQLSPLAPTLFAFWTTADLDTNARIFAKSIGVWYMDGQTLSTYIRELELRDYVMSLPRSTRTTPPSHSSPDS